MRATRQDPQRSIDFSAVNNPSAIQRAILQFVGRRKNPQRESDIRRWFRATPPAHISVALTFLIGREELEVRRTGLRRWVLEYSIPEQV